MSLQICGKFNVEKINHIGSGSFKERRKLKIDPVSLTPSELREYLKTPKGNRAEFVLRELVDLDDEWFEDSSLNVEFENVRFLRAGTEEEIKEYIQEFVDEDPETESPEEFISNVMKHEKALRSWVFPLINEENLDI